MSAMNGQQNRVFTGAVLLVHAVFLLLALHYTRIYMGDSHEYIYEALNIKLHGFFYSGNPAMPIEPEYMTQRQPGYPLFLLLVYGFVVNNWVVLVLQHLLSVANVLYMRQLLLRLGHQPRYDWLLMLLVVAYPAQFVTASTIAPDILLQTCALLYFGCFLQWIQERALRPALYMSLVLVAGMLVKPVLYPFAAVHVLVLAVGVITGGNTGVKWLLPALLPIAAILLYNGWNYQRTGKFHFSSNQSFNAFYYYYPYLAAQHGHDSAAQWLQAERAAYAAMPSYKDRYDYANRRGKAMLTANFVPYMAYHLRHSARIFIEPGKAELDLFSGRLTYGQLYSKAETGFYATWKREGLAGLAAYTQRNPSLPIALLVLAVNILRLVGLVLFAWCRRVPLAVRLFGLFFMAYFALAAGPIANTRYFLPVSLLAIGCASLGLQQWMMDRKTRRA